MRVLLISQFFYPDMVSTGLHMTELTTKIKKLRPDIDIQVFTSHLTREDFEGENLDSETYKGVKIKRVSNLGQMHGNILNRFIFTVSFFFKSLFYSIKSRNRFDLLVTTTNPTFLLWMNLLLKKTFGSKYVVISYDIYPQILSKLGILSSGSLVYKAWMKLNAKAYRDADKVISIGDDMTGIIMEDYQFQGSENITLIHNWADKSKVYPVPREENKFIGKYDLSGKRILLYSGTIGATHNIESILDAALELQDLDDVVFLFIGGGVKKKAVIEFKEKHRLENLVHLPFQPFEDMPHVLSSATISFVCLEDKFTGLSVPSKTYGILAAGVPVMALLDADSEIGQTLLKNDCGVIWNENMETSLHEFIRNTIDDDDRLRELSSNALKTFKEQYDIDVSAEKYIQTFERVAQSES